MKSKPLPDIDPSRLSRSHELREALELSLVFLEHQAGELKVLREELRKVQDELLRLKGEKGKPQFKGKSKGGGKNGDKNGDKGGDKGGGGGSTQARGVDPVGGASDEDGEDKKQRAQIQVDRDEEVSARPSGLPSDARIKSWESHIVQEIVLRRDTVRYRVAVWYSPSTGKTYRAPYGPTGGFGSYGPTLCGFLRLMNAGCDVTQGRLLSFCGSMGLRLSAGTLDGILKGGSDAVLRERGELLFAGLDHSGHVCLDSTGSRQQGKPLYTQVLCSPLFTVYGSYEGKSRLHVLCALLGLGSPEELPVRLDDLAQAHWACFGVSARQQKALLGLYGPEGEGLTVGALRRDIAQKLPKLAAQKIVLERVLNGCALSHYFQRKDFPSPAKLMSDDAPEYKLLCENQGLCWVHDWRHYKKLSPELPLNRRRLEAFGAKYWAFYRKLLAFGQKYAKGGKRGRNARKAKLYAEFDRLFSTDTQYGDLDKLIQKTREKRRELLLSLEHPGMPLHNNAAELAVRRKVRKRDVSLHTISELGTKLQDAYLSIIESAQKLGISAFEYLCDFFKTNRQMTPLVEIIRQKANAQRAP